jgi:hypothetical protein
VQTFETGLLKTKGRQASNLPNCEGSANTRRIEMTPEELAALLSGIDLSTATRRKRYRRAG